MTIKPQPPSALLHTGADMQQREKWRWRICACRCSKYKFADNDKLYFVSFAITNWIDFFIREIYKEEILKSIRYCHANKGLDLYGWCIMTSHVHMITGTKGNPLQNIMRDLKRHTSEVLHKVFKIITVKAGESGYYGCSKERQRKIKMLQSFNYGNRKAIRYN